MIGQTFIDVRLDGGAAGPLLDWCPASNLLALQGSSKTPSCIDICFLEPCSPEEHVAAQLPRDVAADERLIALQWSPLRTARILLAATSAGEIFTWTQSPLAPTADRATSLDEWFCYQAFKSPSEPVLVKWLGPPCVWRWPAQPQQSGQHPHSLESRFGPYQPAQLLWLRPSLLCCVIVTKDAQLQTFWKGLGGADKWLSCAPIQLPMPVAGALAHADVTADMQGGLHVLAMDHAGSAETFRVQGDPTAVDSRGMLLVPLACTHSGTVKAAHGHQVHATAFQPASAGTEITMLSSAPGSGIPAISVFSHHPEQLSWECTAQSQLAAGSSTSGAAAVLTHAADGSFLAVVCGSEDSSKLVLLDCTSLQVIEETPLPAAALAVCVSPNCVCAATSCTGGEVKFTRLLARLQSDAVALGRELGSRIAWSLVNGTSSCDVESLVKRPGTSNDSACLRAALSHIDAALHTQPQASRQTYGQALNHVKLRLLLGVDDASARAVLQDLWARYYLASSEPVVQMMHKVVEEQRAAQPKGTQPAQQVSFSQSEKAAAAGWAVWAEQYCIFFLQSLRYWVKVRAAAGDTDTEDLDALPCIRLLPDTVFPTSLRHALTLQVLLKRNERDKDSANKAAVAQALISAVQAVQNAIAEAQGGATAAIESAEVPGAQLAVAEAAANSFQGAYRLHYHRTQGAVSWQTIQALYEGPTLATVLRLLPAPSWDFLQKAARRLGLFQRGAVPPAVRPAVWRENTLPPTLPDPGYRAIFRELDGSQEAAALKRRRWHMERDTAMGLLPDASFRKSQIDAVSGHSLGWQANTTHVTAHGLSGTAELALATLQHDATAGVHLQMLRRAWLHACPVTGLPWKRAKPVPISGE